jgi:hypothetical protein
MHNPPSIPSHDFVFGYEEENGELVRQKNTEKVHLGTKNDTVGPGEYEAPRALGNSRRGMRWQAPKNSKNKGMAALGTRNSTSAVGVTGVGVDTPGPGHYLAEKTDLAPIYKYKQSSVFASKVDRNSGKRLRNTQSELGPSKKGRAAAGLKSTNPLSPTQGS